MEVRRELTLRCSIFTIALAFLASPAFPHLPDKLEEARKEVLSRYAASGSCREAAGPLMSVIQDPDLEVRLAVEPLLPDGAVAGVICAVFPRTIFVHVNFAAVASRQAWGVVLLHEAAHIAACDPGNTEEYAESVVDACYPE